ncbi:MAG: glycosyltransferase family 2 protein [Chloroflexi bacterium]|nr:glycosyltransferase family 2 protein [Chloroflexota bacterium]MBV9898094.1 glycosyltransferase family 2 protein [Chloroflexota bacterium]
MPDLSVSVVTYRTPALLRRCLTALAAERACLDLDVTVVDNASGDDTLQMLETEFPWVRVIANPVNAGFGAAHNQALRQARGRHWLIFNSDAAPQPGALRTLVDFLDANPSVAVVGPRLRYPNGEVQSSRRRFPTPATLFLESTQLQRFWPDNAVLRHFYVKDRSDDELQDVDWLVGACLCVRAAAAGQAGLFDERFFMYSEELDWCRRFRAAGWRVVYVPTAEVIHLEGGSSRADLVARDQRFQASKLAYAAKWHGPLLAQALRAYLVVEYAVRALEEGGKLALGSRVAERRARLRVIGNGLRSTLGR